MNLEWAWNGPGMGMEWMVWNGCGMDMEWVWNGPGMGVEWTWNGPGMGMESIPQIMESMPKLCNPSIPYGFHLDYMWNGKVNTQRRVSPTKTPTVRQGCGS